MFHLDEIYMSIKQHLHGYWYKFSVSSCTCFMFLYTFARKGQLPIIMEEQRFQVVHIVTVGHAPHKCHFSKINGLLENVIEDEDKFRTLPKIKTIVSWFRIGYQTWAAIIVHLIKDAIFGQIGTSKPKSWQMPGCPFGRSGYVPHDSMLVIYIDEDTKYFKRTVLILDIFKKKKLFTEKPWIKLLDRGLFNFIWNILGFRLFLLDNKTRQYDRLVFRENCYNLLWSFRLKTKTSLSLKHITLEKRIIATV